MFIEDTPRPPVITVVSEPGMGKTTLACSFPNAIIIRSEDGIESVPKQYRPAIMPVCTTVDQFEQQIRWVVAKRKEHKRNVLIIDSITAFERMFEDHIVLNDHTAPSSINQACGGFGAGPKALGALHGKFRKLIGAANDRGFTVIILAHASVETVEPPDGENYSRYTVRLGKHSVAPWTDDVDMIGYIKLQRFTRGEKGDKVKKASSDGQRLLVCYATPGNISKNRFGIEDDIELPSSAELYAKGNPLLAIIPYFTEVGIYTGEKVVKAEVIKQQEPERKQQSNLAVDTSDMDEPESDQANDDEPASAESDQEPGTYDEPEL